MNTYSDRQIKIRLSQIDKEIIKQASSELGISSTEFFKYSYLIAVRIEDYKIPKQDYGYSKDQGELLTMHVSERIRSGMKQLMVKYGYKNLSRFLRSLVKNEITYLKKMEIINMD